MLDTYYWGLRPQSVETQGKGREICYIYFERISYAFNPISGSLRVAAEIQKILDRYVSHSTWAYRVENMIYVATEVMMKVEPIQEKNDPPLLGSSCGSDDSPGNGEHSVSASDSMSVSYMIIRPQQLHRPNQRSTDGLYGEPILTCENKLFKFKDIPFPMTRLLYGVRTNYSKGSWPSAKWPYRMKAQAEFIQPAWFKQNEWSRVVASESCVSDFLRLKLSNAGSFEIKKASMFLTKITLTLKELTWAMAEGAHGPTLSAPKWRLGEKEIFSHSCNLDLFEMSDSTSQSKATFSVPPELYDCKLPDVAPTYFSNKLIRTYALEAKIGIESEGISQTLSTFSEIYIAARQFQSSVSFGERELPGQVPEKGFSFSIFTIEKFQRSRLDLDDISRSNLLRVSKLRDCTYSSHQTDCIALGKATFAVTTIDVVQNKRPKFPSDCMVRNIASWYGISDLGSGPRLDLKEPFILCGVLEMPNSNGAIDWRQVGLFLHVNQLIHGPYSFPLGLPLSPDLPIFRSSRTASIQFEHFQESVMTKLSVVAGFKAPTGFQQSYGEDTVVPGMKISEFCTLELRLPYAFKELSTLPGTAHCIVEKISFFICEAVTLSTGKVPLDCKRSRKLMSYRLKQKIFWTGFEEDEDAQILKRALNTRQFDCVIPSLGPTFFSLGILREYALIIKLSIRIDKRGAQKLCLHQRLNIANRFKGCWRSLENDTVNAAPPPYRESDMSLAKSKPGKSLTKILKDKLSFKKS